MINQNKFLIHTAIFLFLKILNSLNTSKYVYKNFRILLNSLKTLSSKEVNIKYTERKHAFRTKKRYSKLSTEDERNTCNGTIVE